MKILYFTRYPEACASTRYRILQFIPHLKQRGIDVSVHSLIHEDAYPVFLRGGGIIKKLSILGPRVGQLLRRLTRIGRYDRIVIHKDIFPYGPAIAEEAVLRGHHSVLYELDDAMFHPYADTKSWIQRFRNTSKIDRIMGGVAHVIAGNEYLADYARQLNSMVSVVPTVVDLNRYHLPDGPGREDAPVGLGWAGTSGNLPHLEIVRPAIARLQRRHPGVRMTVIADDFPAWRDVQVEGRTWSLEREIDDLSSLDIGIMPLRDDRWARGKCGFKLIQYMALGIPVVASPVGVNCEIVEHGRNGFLASSEAEWEDALERLIRDPALRAHMGAEARSTVESRYSVQAVLPNLERILRSPGAKPASRVHGEQG